MARVYMNEKRRILAAQILARTEQLAKEQREAKQNAREEKVFANLAVAFPLRTVEETSAAQVEASKYSKGLLENAIKQSWK